MICKKLFYNSTNINCNKIIFNLTQYSLPKGHGIAMDKVST